MDKNKANFLLKKFTLFWPSAVILLTIPLLNTLDVFLEVDHGFNHRVLNYQLEKISDKKNRNVETVFLGDSSCGNGINAAHFSKLSGFFTINLCLTGTYNIASNIVLARHIAKELPMVKRYIFVHTPDTITREYPKEGIFLTMLRTRQVTLASQFSYLDLIERMFSTSAAALFLIDNIRNINDRKIDHNIEVDYISQLNEKYSNGLLKSDTSVQHDYEVNQTKMSELSMLNSFCCENSSKRECYYLNGPSIRKISANMRNNMNRLFKNFKCIKFYDQDFNYDVSWFGDSSDHIDYTKKLMSTEAYHKVLTGKISIGSKF